MSNPRSFSEVNKDMTEEIIRLKNIKKYYDENTHVLEDLNLVFNKGTWTSIIGPSGSGKTTLLNIIGCLDSPTAGSVFLNGTEITSLNQAQLTRFRRENIGLIFQQYHLVPYLTTLENVMMAQYYHGSPNEQKAIDALYRVGLGHRLTHIPAHLSGGEQQRVCIARALINEPKILLADEPTGNLDQKNGEIVLSLIRELHQEGHTIILVTHNNDIAKLGQRIITVIDGKICSDSACSYVINET
jgi:putative ABC transport system ATP-binding protein